MTPTFKEIVAQDIDSVFFNANEFCEEHTIVIDGEILKLNVQIDNHELINRSKGSKEYTEGIFKKQFIIFVKASEFGRMPKIGAKLKLDKAEYEVLESFEEMGVYSITLEAKRG